MPKMIGKLPRGLRKHPLQKSFDEIAKVNSRKNDVAWLAKKMVARKNLSRAARETLAIVAYHQPVTKLEIEEIRGVSVGSGTIDLLMDLEWIKFGRRKSSPGRPVTFQITDKFLDYFDLSSLKDLPGVKELRDLGLSVKNLNRD